jgi:hypothetical protein
MAILTLNQSDGDRLCFIPKACDPRVVRIYVYIRVIKEERLDGPSQWNRRATFQQMPVHRTLTNSIVFMYL